MTDPWQAVEYPPEFKRGVKEYLKPKSFLRRGFYPAFEPKKPMPSWEDMISGKADEQLDQPTADPIGPIGAISLPMARIGAKNLIRRRWSRAAVKDMPDVARRELKAIEALDIDDLVKKIPEGLWERIQEFRSTTRHPTRGNKYMGMHTSGPSPVRPEMTMKQSQKGRLWVDPHSKDPSGVMTHEVGHEAAQAFLDWSAKEYKGVTLGKLGVKSTGGKPGAFAKLRKEWGEIAADMKYLETSGQAGKYKGDIYSLNPDEIFSNRFSEALAEGMEFNEAVKFGVHEVRANLSASRDLAERVNREFMERARVKGIAF